MATQTHDKPNFYDETYKQHNYFNYKNWLYEPYVSSLVSFCGLSRGASVLDVGCGQGLFSYLFSKNAMRVQGIDTSETGILTARRLYGHLGIKFDVVDAETAAFPEQFDCIFVRSCSLYNTDSFPRQSEPTRTLLKHLKPGGSFIFVYNSNFSSKVSPKWRYHSLEEVRQHFNGYPNAQIFFLNKTTAFFLGAYSFTPFVRQVNASLSRASGTGGDVICIFRKDSGAIKQDAVRSLGPSKNEIHV
jgi:SAM-dependent methyltransferase